MKRNRLAPVPKGTPMACFFCGFAAIKGLKTAMKLVTVGPNAGKRIHADSAVCDALRTDAKLRAEVIENYGEPEVPASLPVA